MITIGICSSFQERDPKPGSSFSLSVTIYMYVYIYYFASLLFSLVRGALVTFATRWCRRHKWSCEQNIERGRTPRLTSCVRHASSSLKPVAISSVEEASGTANKEGGLRGCETIRFRRLRLCESTRTRTIGSVLLFRRACSERRAVPFFPLSCLLI